MSKRIVVIGSGFAGLAAAASLAQHGHDVIVVDKNAEPGGRARVWKQDGFTFDMGPSFYWMPDVFERFFMRFGKRVDAYYQLVRLDPSYKVIFGAGDEWSLPVGREALRTLFESKEPGAANELDRFLAEAKVKYDLGMRELVYRPSLSWKEYAHWEVLRGLMKTSVLRSMRKHVRSHFRDEKLRSLLEFPSLFLGASPQNTPALYSLMNYADLELGTWYPMGGMGEVVNGIVRLAMEQGVRFLYGEAVEHIITEPGNMRAQRVAGVRTTKGVIYTDVVVAAADYHHVEQELLPEELRDHTERYWERRTMAPSSLLFYLGFNRRVPYMEHHTLFFDEPLDLHTSEIHDTPKWPSRPLFYASCTSKTDATTAPEGHENMVVLIPIASGLVDDDATRERYFLIVMERLARQLGFDPRPHIVVKRSYCINDLRADYNAYRGNAYGLANTLSQTGPLRPSVKSRKVEGLYYTGHLTVPGPGVPPALISGQLVADLISNIPSQQRTRA